MTAHQPSYYNSDVSRSSLNFLLIFADIFLSLMVVATFLDLPSFLFKALDYKPWHIYASMCLIISVIVFSSTNYRQRLFEGIKSFWPFIFIVCINFIYAELGEASHMSDVGGIFSASLIGLVLGMLIRTVDYRVLRWAFCAIVILLSFGLIIDSFFIQNYFISIQPNRVLGRSAFTHNNPNQAAEALLLSLSFLCYLEKRESFILIFKSIAAFPIILTLSRAGIVVFLLLCSIPRFIEGRKFIRSFITSALLILTVIASSVPFLIFASQYMDVINLRNIEDRIGFFSDFNTDDTSSQFRESYLSIALDKFLESPLLGHYPGFSYETTIEGVGYHNMFAAIAVDYGLIPFIIFAYIIISILIGSLNLGITFLPLALSVFSFTFSTHNMFDAPYWFLSLIFAFEFIRRNKITKPMKHDLRVD